MNTDLFESSGWPISWRLHFIQLNSGRGEGLQGQKSMRARCRKVFESSDAELLRIKCYPHLSCLLQALRSPPRTIANKKVLQMVVLWENENDVAALLLLLLLWLRAKFWCCCRNPEPASTAVCLASRERAGVKPTRRALGLDTQLSQTCLKKLLQRSQLLTNWPPHGDSLIIVLQKLSNIHWFSRGFKERERGSPGVLGLCCDLSSWCCRCLELALMTAQAPWQRPPFEPRPGIHHSLLCGSLAHCPPSRTNSLAAATVTERSK